jgi:seryl-tRNA synthetase
MAEKTNEQLTVELTQLKKDLAEAQKRAEKAEKAAASAGGAAEQVKKLKAQLQSTTEALKVAEKTAPKTAKPVVKLGDAYYQVVGGERRNGKVISRDELAKDTARCAELMAMGSGLLRKVNID